MGRATAASAVTPALLYLNGCASKEKEPLFHGISPSFKDEVQLADGLNYNILAKWGDRINKKGEVFGSHNDFNCFLPFKDKKDEALLWVNHESVTPQFLHNKNSGDLKRNVNEIIKEQEMVGGSIIHIKKRDGKWSLVKNSKFNRRIHGRTRIPFSNNFKIQGSNVAVGTLANCSGGITPWKTFLTSEENYDGFYGDIDFSKGKRKFIDIKKHRWHTKFPLPPEHYGWVVEIDPWTGVAEKQILLGRAPHEGATSILTKDDKAVVYMGEDRPGGFIYKFVSTGKHFKEGTLYAADTKKGQWLPLDIKKNPKLKKHFDTQLEVLTYSHKAAATVGATPQDRPEDIEIDPKTGDIFVALTKNPKTNNLYGGVLKIQENSDFDSLTFKSDIWLSGGFINGFACPDNFCFDRKGNIWMTVDMPDKNIGQPAYKAFGNNGLFYIPMSGKGAGIPIQVASAPVDAEFTGPWFSNDGKTLFLSVQHPGISAAKKDIFQPTSHWPDGKGKTPRSAVIAIQGNLIEKLV
jgi:hypothetical protein